MPAGDHPALERARHKAYRRLIPLLFAAYAIAYVDRTIVGYAKLEMSKDLGLDNAQYAWGAGLFFFAGYLLLEIPGSLIVERWSARRWISRIMVTWGLVAALTAAVKTAPQFYVARFALGLAEAGFFPGIIVYLTHWFPRRDRARALAYLILAQPVASMAGPLLSAPLLAVGTDEVVGGVVIHHAELWGLEGWQWVYIVWGLPAVVIGVVVLLAMPDRPAQARWLSADERDALEAALAADRAELARSTERGSWLPALAPIALLAATNFLVVIGHYGIDFFLPTILQKWYGLSFRGLKWAALPYGALVVGLVLVSQSSDRRGERWLHTALPMLVGAAALALATVVRGSFVATLALFCVAIVGIRIYLPPFYALPGFFVRGTAAAAAIGFINTMGNLGGAVGPSIIALVEKRTGGFEGGLRFLCVSVALSASVVLGLRAWHKKQRAPAAASALVP